MDPCSGAGVGDSSHSYQVLVHSLPALKMCSWKRWFLPKGACDLCRGVEELGDGGWREVERRHTCKPPTKALKEVAEKEVVTSALVAAREASQGT